jgi:hypothetical protein
MVFMSTARAICWGAGAQSTLYMESGAARLRGPAPCERSTISNVHRDFHAEPEINGLRGFPFHTNILKAQ